MQMDKVMIAWGRGLACVLILASLAGCNDDLSPGSLREPGASNPPGQPNPPPQVNNVAPQIAGSPGTEVAAGQSYSFVPNASDPDGDNLTFSIAGKPAWASFNKSTGRMAGTPDAADVGMYDNITIRVSDGQSTRALPQFAIDVVQQSSGSVTLAWQAPTENTDGSPLTNLHSYKIHYGTRSGQYTTTIDVNNSGLTRYVVDSLSPGTYYFAITAVAASGAESDFSGEASKTI